MSFAIINDHICCHTRMLQLERRSSRTAYISRSYALLIKLFSIQKYDCLIAVYHTASVLLLLFKWSLDCVSKNDIDIAHYNFNIHQPILVIFSRDVAERVCYENDDLLSHLS